MQAAPLTKTPKKLVIKNLSNRSRVPKNYEVSAWQKLNKAVNAIHRSLFVNFSFEELYGAVEELCREEATITKLHIKLKEVCMSHIKKQSLLFQSCLPDESFLIKIEKEWQDHCNQSSLIRSIFLVLDTKCIQSSNQSLWDMSLNLFRENVLYSNNIGDKCVQAILQLIETERKGGQIFKRSLLRNLLDMFTQLNVYKVCFEDNFIASTQDFYKNVAQTKLCELTVADYLKFTESKMEEESKLCLKSMNYVTEGRLLECLDETLIVVHHEEILQKGFSDLLKADMRDDLYRLYSLFKSTEGKSLMCDHYNKYNKIVVEDIVTNEGPNTMVKSLLDHKKKVDNLNSICFRGHDKFVNTIRDAFAISINKRQNTPAEYIAKYVDQKMRSNKLSEAEIEHILDKIMVLFRFVSGKDVFEAFYKADLAKRLLIGRSSSFDAEKSMLSKLKQECGSLFTTNLEGMFKDMAYSKEMMVQFKLHLENQNTEFRRIEMSVNVLTSVYWPTYKTLRLPLPNEMLSLQESFTNFYKSKHSGRNLNFHHCLGHCMIRSRFKNLTSLKELQASLLQTVILLNFNYHNTLTYNELKERTKLDHTDLKRILQSLACGKARVILKEPKSKEVNETDSFSFNDAFTHKQYKIKINSIQMKETPKENKKVNSKVVESRKNQIEACIVRIMKTRKQLTHQELISEVGNQLSLRFPIASKDIKKIVEGLMEREYIRRDEQQSNVYHYVA